MGYTATMTTTRSGFANLTVFDEDGSIAAQEVVRPGWPATMVLMLLGFELAGPVENTTTTSSR